MLNATNIKEHMAVVGSDGEHIGTVDHLEGTDKIKLTKNDPAAQGKHHLIPLEWVETVEDKVVLSKSSQDAMRSWQTAD